MKIKVIDGDNKPVANQSIRLQVKGKDTLSLRTNERGEVQLDEKYQGQQIAEGQQSGAAAAPKPKQWITATEGASIKIEQQVETTFK